MSRVAITKTEEQIVHIIVRQLTDEYIVQKAIIDANRALAGIQLGLCG